MRNILIFLFLFGYSFAGYAQTSTLTVDQIMQDPKWMGISPNGIFWDRNSQTIYFDWNPESDAFSALYQISPINLSPEKVRETDREAIIRNYRYDRGRKRILYERHGDIYLRDLRSDKVTQLTHTTARESNPIFSLDERTVYFQQGDNYYAISLSGNGLQQLTNFSRTSSPSRGSQNSVTSQAQNHWLKNDQLALFDVFREKKRLDSIRSGQAPTTLLPDRMRTVHIGDNALSHQEISPDGRYVTYRLTTAASGNTNTVVPNYVTQSGYTETIPTRTKVGNSLPTTTTYVYDLSRDTTYQMDLSGIPGLKDLADFWDDYPEEKEKRLTENKDRQVNISATYWNEKGTAAFVVAHATDNKDRWILRLIPEDGTLIPIDRQRDEAWIAGPGIGSSWGGGNLGWIDEELIYFQSEASGYSHIYSANIHTALQTQLTSGNWEVQTLQLSNDKKSFYFTGNIDHPGIKHFYRIPTQGGTPIQLTQEKGGNEVTLSPDEKWLAIRHSKSNEPWELYLQENKAGAQPKKVTESTTTAFNAYKWRNPEMITFNNRHGGEIHARLYQPDKPKPNKPAVIFVHGAGYLQNVHYWWSQYFREYMFHNLLADLGYTVLDIDFTASSGYGRDHRTGIYRHMGGKDLTDQVDGARLLTEKYGVNPKNIGIYGGSYGGFITLMAMFNEPDVFAAGAALRSVTDWAHYNHGYTANILNEPIDDPLAYRRSSPIYFAEGLQGHLLMCHGMVDVNVHFQDIVRLSQRLIELRKDNWELAVYPVEDHAFTEPTSWADEYRRILKLFEERLTN